MTKKQYHINLQCIVILRNSIAEIEFVEVGSIWACTAQKRFNSGVGIPTCVAFLVLLLPLVNRLHL